MVPVVGCGRVCWNAPEGWPPVEPLGAAGPVEAVPPVGPTTVLPTTPVAGAPGAEVIEPAGTLFAGSGALADEFGAGGDWLAPDWARAGEMASVAAAKAVKMAVRIGLLRRVA